MFGWLDGGLRNPSGSVVWPSAAALRAGVNDFLIQPIDAPRLRRTPALHVRARAAESLP